MRYVLISLSIILGCLIVYGVVEALIVKYNGKTVAVPDISRTPQTSGTGPKLTYVVMGDSTAIGQGTEYKNSFAVQTTKHLAVHNTVTLHNTGISGARIHGVIDSQLESAIKLRPDIVLLSVGANDITHFTNPNDIRTSLEKIIRDLRSTNPDVQIVATRSPAVDSVSRFPFVSKYILKTRVNQVNTVFDEVIKTHAIIPAYIAEKTRDIFLSDPTLTADDNFHPNKRGYAVWTPILNDALDLAIKNINTAS